MTQIADHSELVREASQRLLKQAMEILLACGLEKEDLRNIMSSEMEHLKLCQPTKTQSTTSSQVAVCRDVVLRWRRDHRFLNEHGLPRALELQGGDRSFADLVSVIASDCDPSAVLSDLLEFGAVRQVKDGCVELVTASIVACSGPDGGVVAPIPVLEHVCGFLGSVVYNLTQKPSRARGRFERACYARISRDMVPILENLVSERGQDFVDAIDEWLGRKAVPSPEISNTVLVGAGAYVFKVSE